MKIREGFVSNSSSSSFILNMSDIFVIPGMHPNTKDKKTLLVPESFGGEYEFGRQRENYTDFGSRLNWIYFQIKSIEKFWERIQNDPDSFKNWGEDNLNNLTNFAEKYHDRLDTLEEVLKEAFNVSKVEFNFQEDWTPVDEFGERKGRYGYIDHQSLWMENLGHIEVYEDLLKDKETIFNWLFGVDNKIFNRSDEWSDCEDMEVDHRLDYFDWDQLYDD